MYLRIPTHTIVCYFHNIRVRIYFAVNGGECSTMCNYVVELLVLIRAPRRPYTFEHPIFISARTTAPADGSVRRAILFERQYHWYIPSFDLIGITISCWCNAPRSFSLVLCLLWQYRQSLPVIFVAHNLLTLLIPYHPANVQIFCSMICEYCYTKYECKRPWEF